MKRSKFHARAYLALCVVTSLMTATAVYGLFFRAHSLPDLFKPETIDLLTDDKKSSMRALGDVVEILKRVSFVACVCLFLLSVCLAQLWRLYRRIEKSAP